MDQDILDKNGNIDYYALSNASIPKTYMPDAFWYARDLGNTYLPVSRITLFYRR